MEGEISSELIDEKKCGELAVMDVEEDETDGSHQKWLVPESS